MAIILDRKNQFNQLTLNRSIFKKKTVLKSKTTDIGNRLSAYKKKLTSGICKKSPKLSHQDTGLKALRHTV